MTHANGGSFPGTPDNADQACGAIDTAAKFPELVHYDCRACRKIVTMILADRKPQTPMPRPPQQDVMFDDLRPYQMPKR